MDYAAKSKLGPPNRAKGFEQHFRKSAFEPSILWDSIRGDWRGIQAVQLMPQSQVHAKLWASQGWLHPNAWPKSQIPKDSRLSQWHFTHSWILISLGSAQPLAVVTIQCLCNSYIALQSCKTFIPWNLTRSLQIRHGSLFIPPNSSSVLPYHLRWHMLAPSVLRTSAIGAACCSKPGVAAACSSDQKEKDGNAERKWCNMIIW